MCFYGTFTDDLTALGTHWSDPRVPGGTLHAPVCIFANVRVGPSPTAQREGPRHVGGTGWQVILHGTGDESRRSAKLVASDRALII